MNTVLCGAVLDVLFLLLALIHYYVSVYFGRCETEGRHVSQFLL